MSNIFTYSIDERNLRVQLRAMEATPCSEAWARFESYADANPFRSAKRSFPGMNISLNRNVVLPAVFAVVICLFALLLVNFVTIKNPQEQNDQKAELSPVIPAPQVSIVDIAQPAEPSPQVAEQQVIPSATKPAPAEIIAEKPAEAIAEPQNQDVTSAANSPVASQEQVAEQVVKRKYKKAVSIEEQIRPTTFTEDTDPEVMPN